MKIRYLTTLVLAAAICSMGCASMDKSKLPRPNALKGFMSEEEPEFTTPSSMVAIWKPSTYDKPGSDSLRGFGGRFYFYDAQNEPVKVEGLLTIYGYDDAKGDTAGKADRKFIFEAKTMQEHHSDSGIGDSYSFWVPWDKVGGLEKTITLIPVFKSTNGQIPESKPATLRLPGRKPEVIASAQDSLYGPGTQVISASGIVSKQPMVKQAVALTEINGSSEPVRRRPTTLRLPRKLADRIARTPASSRTLDGSSEVETSGQANVNQANSIPSELGPPYSDTGQSRPQARQNRPVFGQPGSF